MGRSPRTRGRPKCCMCNMGDDGSIPAYAGETAKGRQEQKRIRVDPRVRGGDTKGPSTSHISPGRSPRTRGRLSYRARQRLTRGSIPAYAGETDGSTASIDGSKVDPRVRGGDGDEARTVMRDMGRSPRTRGRRKRRLPGLVSSRSIPAYAGETTPPWSRSCAIGVDPRVRGGDKNTSRPGNTSSGRSPRTRGRRRVIPWPRSLLGSIPAYAGETPTSD